MTMHRQEEWTKLKNILCIRLDNMGDVLMTSPAIRALKNSVPERKITLLTSSAGSAIAKYIPEVDDVLVFDTPWEKNSEGTLHTNVLEITEVIGKKKFDAAVIFTVYSQNPLPAAMLCYIAGIPRVAGYCRENPYTLITDWIPDKEPLLEIKHEVSRQLNLTTNLGAISENNSFSLSIPESASNDILDKLDAYKINTSEKFIVMHPGVSEAKRQYDVNSFARTAKMIVEELGYQIILTGTKSEKHLAHSILQVSTKKTFDLSGKLNIEELIALIKNASLLISNNSGPVHIAAAVHTPVVVLYALTNPQHTPWNVAHKILPFEVPEKMRSKNCIVDYAQKKSFRKKLNPVKPEDIFVAAKELLSASETVSRTNVLYL